MNVPRTGLQEALERFDANPPEDYLAWKKKLRRQTVFISALLIAGFIGFFVAYALVFWRIFYEVFAMNDEIY